MNSQTDDSTSMPLVKAHILDGKEVRITDPMDYCLFHAVKMKKFEYGYTLSAKGETQTIILGEITEDQLAEKQKEIETANRMERMPGLRGKILTNPANYFVREIKIHLDARSEGE